jgi:hypothetical protein
MSGGSNSKKDAASKTSSYKIIVPDAPEPDVVEEVELTVEKTESEKIREREERDDKLDELDFLRQMYVEEVFTGAEAMGRTIYKS